MSLLKVKILVRAVDTAVAGGFYQPERGLSELIITSVKHTHVGVAGALFVNHEDGRVTCFAEGQWLTYTTEEM